MPAPGAEDGHVVIQTICSLVSPGTEKMLVNFAKASLFQKARSQPDKVKQVLAKIRSDGLKPTLDAVFRRLNEPLPLGYCNVGKVLALGAGVNGIGVGDIVVSNGPHAEIVSVPENLVAKVPPTVAPELAAFTVIGAIGLQGIRLTKPEFGETVVVVGLGLIGQITAQLLKSHGCKVIAFDIDPSKLEIATQQGVTAVNSREIDPVKYVLGNTGGVGADAVIITASSSSNDIIAQSAQMCRTRARIILVGVIGLALNRADFYQKELTFQVSCSYGPGRYDESYEEKGHDYPIGYVRWTENRNFRAILDAMASGTLRVEPLITKRVPLADFQSVYGSLGGGLGIVLDYNKEADAKREIRVGNASFAPGGAGLALIGAGNFSKMTVLPALKDAGVSVRTIVSASGVTGTSLAQKYGIAVSSTDYDAVLRDENIRGVIITTRHNLHASMILSALRAGKHVLVEKPLCLRISELEEIERVQAALPKAPTLTVGYNRRFSPHAIKMKALLGSSAGAVSVVATMNAGAIPPAHWVHDPLVGGGRLLGEACHLVDFAIFMTGSPIVRAQGIALGETSDTASLLFQHANGSTTVVNYFANGHRAISKERVEVHSQGRSLLLDNFRELQGHGFSSFKKLSTSQDKGHARQFALFAERMRDGGPPLIPWAEIANGTRAIFAALHSIKEQTGTSVT
ncbi:MAG: bi-domain-containing oxidoreductase [Verrucomicrobiota bacterium]